jgi:uncharacterized protein (DUF983 family)
MSSCAAHAPILDCDTHALRPWAWLLELSGRLTVRGEETEMPRPEADPASHKPARVIVSPVLAGLRGGCPRCAKGALFRRGLVLRDRCSGCDLDFHFVDTGDGPAIFAIFILGFLVLGMAVIAEFKFGAPIWFHVVAWGLLTPLLAIGLLRGLKGLLIALQYRNKAEQAQLARK